MALTCTAALADGAPRGSIKDRPLAAPFNWTGFYIGGNVGVAIGSSDVANTFDPDLAGYWAGVGGAATPGRFTNAGTGSLDDTSFTGGGQIGYNIQAGTLVYGIEADLNYLGYKNSRTARVDYFNPPGGTGVDINDQVSADYLATVRGRVGFASGNLLGYVTAGFAFTSLKHTHSVNEYGFDALPACAPGGNNWCDLGGSKSSVRTGWTIGGGGEYAFNRNWTFKAEYLYADLGKVSSSTSIFNNGPPLTAVPLSGIGHSADLTIHTARVGLNYKF